MKISKNLFYYIVFMFVAQIPWTMLINQQVYGNLIGETHKYLFARSDLKSLEASQKTQSDYSKCPKTNTGKVDLTDIENRKCFYVERMRDGLSGIDYYTKIIHYMPLLSFFVMNFCAIPIWYFLFMTEERSPRKFVASAIVPVLGIILSTFSPEVLLKLRRKKGPEELNKA